MSYPRTEYVKEEERNPEGGWRSWFGLGSNKDRDEGYSYSRTYPEPRGQYSGTYERLSQPYTSGERPSWGTSQPYTSGERPSWGTSQPYTSGERPSWGTSQPYTSGERPSWGTSQPYTGERGYGYSGYTGGYGGERGGYGSQNVGEGYSRYQGPYGPSYYERENGRDGGYYRGYGDYPRDYNYRQYYGGSPSRGYGYSGECNPSRGYGGSEYPRGGDYSYRQTYGDRDRYYGGEYTSRNYGTGYGGEYGSSRYGGPTGGYSSSYRY